MKSLGQIDYVPMAVGAAAGVGDTMVWEHAGAYRHRASVYRALLFAAGLAGDMMHAPADISMGAMCSAATLAANFVPGTLEKKYPYPMRAAGAVSDPVPGGTSSLYRPRPQQRITQPTAAGDVAPGPIATGTVPGSGPVTLPTIPNDGGIPGRHPLGGRPPITQPTIAG